MFYVQWAPVSLFVNWCCFKSFNKVVLHTHASASVLWCTIKPESVKIVLLLTTVVHTFVLMITLYSVLIVFYFEGFIQYFSAAWCLKKKIPTISSCICFKCNRSVTLNIFNCVNNSRLIWRKLNVTSIHCSCCIWKVCCSPHMCHVVFPPWARAHRQNA